MEEHRKIRKFKELAEKRTNRALEAIRLIGNLANKQNYHYENQNVRKIVKSFRNTTYEIEGKFNMAPSRSGGEFRL